MKKAIILSILAISAANAESMRTNDPLEARTMRRIQESPPGFDEKRPNEISARRFIYSGIAVEVVRVNNPLQLINPAAPFSYGFAEANLVRDPVGNKASGLKIFSIQF